MKIHRTIIWVQIACLALIALTLFVSIHWPHLLYSSYIFLSGDIQYHGTYFVVVNSYVAYLMVLWFLILAGFYLKISCGVFPAYVRHSHFVITLLAFCFIASLMIEEFLTLPRRYADYKLDVVPVNLVLQISGWVFLICQIVLLLILGSNKYRKLYIVAKRTS